MHISIAANPAETAVLPKRLALSFCLVLFVHCIVLLLVLPSSRGVIGGLYNEGGFQDGYDLIAANLVSGHGYRLYPDASPTMMREPGYPLLLAGLVKIFGDSFLVVRLSNLIFAILTALLILRLTTRYFSSGLPSWITLLPASMFLLHPGVLLAESRGGVEVLFTLLVVLFLGTLLKAVDSGRWQDYGLCGIVLGITVLVRSTPMLFPCFLAVFLLVAQGRRSFFHIIGNMAVLVLAMVSVLSPWIARNYRLSGKFVPTASVLGVSAQAGQYVQERLFSGTPMWVLDKEAGRERDQIAREMGLSFKEDGGFYYQTFYRSSDELVFSKALFDRVKVRDREDPALFLRCVAQNIIGFWIAGKTWRSTAMNALVQFPYLLLAGLGLVLELTSRRRTAALLIAIFVLYVMSVHVPIIAQARYSIPLVPILVLLSVPALSFLAGKVMKSNETGTAKC